MKDPPLFIGPFLKFDSCLDGIWKGNILFVHSYKIDPYLNLIDNSDVKVTDIVNREILATEFGYNFTKWTITVKQSTANKRQDYIIRFDKPIIHNDHKKKYKDPNSMIDNENCETTLDKEYCFFVPGLSNPWRWAFFSCNDLSHTSGYKGYPEKCGGITPLWTDLVHKHHKHNYNLLVGLGDQLYMDEVFEHVQELEKWTKIPNHITRETMDCSDTLKAAVEKWSFFYYIYHFSQSYFEQAMATIPTLFVISDHDIYDGQGSYPEQLEASPVLSSVREILQKWYLLFQQHTDPSNYFNKVKGYEPDIPLYGDTVTPCVKILGKDLAILALDTRFERSRTRIISDTTYDYIFKCLYDLPETIIHLVVATEIPLIFPDLRLLERWLRKLSDFKRHGLFQKIFSSSTFFKKLGLPFGEPILLTDLIDHWNSDAHMEERNRFLFRLQSFSNRRSIRVTFIGGDVHCCGVGRFSTPSTSKDPIRAHYENCMTIPLTFNDDHRLMYQIISSGIANVAPPWWIVKCYHIIDKSEKVKDNNGDTTMGRMLKFFLRDIEGKILGKKSRKLMGKRNWCSVEMSNVDYSLFFELHVEMFLGAGKTMPYNIIVPKLY